MHLGATMSSVVAAVTKVRELFPNLAEEVSRLAIGNERFRSLCEDYGLAIGALNNLEQRNRPQDIERMIEYRTIIKDLERELKTELLASRS